MDWMLKSLNRGLEIIVPLQQRMDHLRFDPTDKIYVATLKAYNAIHHLSVHLHYAVVEADKRKRAGLMKYNASP